MPTLVEGFVVQNGDTASASYLNTWLTTGGTMISGASKLLGNPTASTGVAGTSNWAEVGIGTNLQFAGSSTLDLAQNIAVTGTLMATGVITGLAAIIGQSLGTTGSVTGSTVTASGAVSGASIGTTGAITGASMTLTGTASASAVLVNHFITGSSAPSVTSFVSISSATMNASKNSDAAMQVKFRCNGLTTPSDNVFRVTFSSSFSSEPIVMMSPGNSDTATLIVGSSSSVSGVIWVESTSSYFTVRTINNGRWFIATDYLFNFHVIG
jgi:hypothetical protein